MRSPRLVLLAAVSILGLGARLAWADPTLDKFGPRVYVQGASPPVTLTERFSVCRPDRAFRLRVENGAAGHARVSSGSVVLNGVEMVSERDFNQSTGLIERPVMLRQDNTLAVRLASRPDSAVAITIASDSGCLAVVIDAPVEGSHVAAGRLVVRGAVRGAPEAGVLVNGFPAATDGETFVAVVNVAPEEVELVARASASDGATAEARRTLVVDAAPEGPLVFRAIPGGGAGGLTTRFSLNSSVPIARLTLDLTGAGGVDFQGTSLQGPTFSYTAPGLYLPTVTVTDVTGATHTAACVVQVYDRTVFDAHVQRRWTSMKDALRRSDVTRALESVALPARDTYRGLLTALTVPLSQIDQVLTDIEFVEMDEFRAEYRMVRVDNGVSIAHFVLVVKDDDGVWRVKFF